MFFRTYVPYTIEPALRPLLRLGFRSVYHMFEGIVGWQKKGFPLSTSS
jgi:hypothetical protein